MYTSTCSIWAPPTVMRLLGHHAHHRISDVEILHDEAEQPVAFLRVKHRHQLLPVILDKLMVKPAFQSL